MSSHLDIKLYALNNYSVKNCEDDSTIDKIQFN